MFGFFVCIWGGVSVSFVIFFLQAKTQLMIRVIQSREGKETLRYSGPRTELSPIQSDMEA